MQRWFGSLLELRVDLSDDDEEDDGVGGDEGDAVQAAGFV